jgi:hypothetical protein
LNDVVATAINNNLRVVDLFVENSASPYSFTATYVPNTGSYARTWWLLADVTPTTLLNFSIANSARIVVMKAFNDPTPGGSVRFFALLISNTGASAKTWFFYKDQTVAQVTALWQANNARLVQVNSYVRNSTTFYDVVMISNTGSDARTWFWYVNATPADLGVHQAASNTRVVDLDIDPATGNYNAIMQSCPSTCPAWWWYFGVPTSNLVSTATSLNARIIDANVRSGCGDVCWDILLIDNSKANLNDVDTTGVFRPSNGALYLKNANTTGVADISINYGLPGDYPVVGDWDGNRTATIGIYRNGTFYLRNSNTKGVAEIKFAFGSPGDQPIAGDWNGDGMDTIGVYNNGTFYLRNSNSAGPPDMVFSLGMAGDVAIAGDWTGKGYDTVGVFRPGNGALFLKNFNTTGVADIQINYGLPGDRPITGDWDGNGTDTIGVYRAGKFLLRNSNTIGVAEISFLLGGPGDMPIEGNWDGSIP